MCLYKANSEALSNSIRAARCDKHDLEAPRISILPEFYFGNTESEILERISGIVGEDCGRKHDKFVLFSHVQILIYPRLIYFRHLPNFIPVASTDLKNNE